MAFGTRRPTILIPAMADTWTDDRRRAVVLHELAHVARYDCLTQSLAFVACALYWFHPVAWWVARRLRIERELACDDRVIPAGAQARDYAGHLLEIAYTFGSHRAPALAVSMARPRQLEGRMLAVLDAARNRRVPSCALRIASAADRGRLLLPLAERHDRRSSPGSQTRITSATSWPSPAAQQEPRTRPALKPMRAGTASEESARRLVRAAAARSAWCRTVLPGTWEIRPTEDGRHRPSATRGSEFVLRLEHPDSSGSKV